MTLEKIRTNRGKARFWVVVRWKRTGKLPLGKLCPLCGNDRQRCWCHCT